MIKHVTFLNDHWIMNQICHWTLWTPSHDFLRHRCDLCRRCGRLAYQKPPSPPSCSIASNWVAVRFGEFQTTQGAAMFSFRVDFIFRPCVASKGSWQSHILGVFLFPSEKNQGLFHI
jgi:hypothetical protein